jgi:hypothetical protein
MKGRIIQKTVTVGNCGLVSAGERKIKKELDGSDTLNWRMRPG